MRAKTIALVALTLVLIPSVVAAGGLAVNVTQADDGTATVSVTENDTGVANATVIVESTDENVTYDGAGEYETDENGTVALPEPSETVTISIEASTDTDSGATEATLEPAEQDDETDGNETTENDTPDNFGQELQQFTLSINESDPNKGLLVAEYATSNNPGNAPDHAGPKSVHEFVNETSERGPPEHAAKNKDEEKGKDKGKDKGNSGGGPPNHANGDSDDGEDE